MPSITKKLAKKRIPNSKDYTQATVTEKAVDNIQATQNEEAIENTKATDNTQTKENLSTSAGLDSVVKRASEIGNSSNKQNKTNATSQVVAEQKNNLPDNVAERIAISSDFDSVSIPSKSTEVEHSNENVPSSSDCQINLISLDETDYAIYNIEDMNFNFGDNNDEEGLTLIIVDLN